MLVIILSALLAGACFKWGAWKRWREFYPTILYIIVGNLAYSFVFCEYFLWGYNSFMGQTYTGLIVNFLIYPPMVILFLTHYPEGKLKQILYILGWSASGTLIEFVAFLTDGIYYQNGWCIWWSSALFVGTFILLRVHHKRPLIVWPVSLASGIAVALIWGLPLPP